MGLNFFELVDVSYYKGLQLSLTRNISAVHVLENIWVS